MDRNPNEGDPPVRQGINFFDDPISPGIPIKGARAPSDVNECLLGVMGDSELPPSLNWTTTGGNPFKIFKSGIKPGGDPEMLPLWP